MTRLCTSAEFVQLRGYHEFDGPNVMRFRRASAADRRARLRRLKRANLRRRSIIREQGSLL